MFSIESRCKSCISIFGLPSHYSRLFSVVFFSAVFLNAPLAGADIYKYRDENGNWQFSDTPPDQKIQSVKVEEVAAPAESASVDLLESLKKEYDPQTAIEETTIAVVKIETPIGTGSGFFVSETGYLVTNKHVIRPLKLNDEEVERHFRNEERRVARDKKKLAGYRSRLKRMKASLDDYRDYMNDVWSDDEKKEARREYNRRKRDYNDYKADVEKYSRRVNQRANELAEGKASYNRRHANASVARHFKIYLKDDTELQASLVKISTEHDLALLKLDGYKVPFVELADKDDIRQGMRVFAVGSPLGLKDYMTSGIVTSLKKKQVITDAQILPGNSGGPLVSEQGKVFGVNTQKLMAVNSIGSEGFGIAIPSSIVLSEFPEAIGHRNPAADSSNPAETNQSLLNSILEDYRAGPE